MTNETFVRRDMFNDFLGDQYLNHKEDFTEWMDTIMQNRPHKAAEETDTS